jgi:WD40 repeat protein
MIGNGYQSNYLIEEETGHILKTYHVKLNLTTCICQLPDQLIATGYEDGQLVVWNSTSELILYRKHEDYARLNTIVYLNDNQTMATGSSYGTLRFWNFRTGQLLKLYANFSLEIRRIKLMKSGLLLFIDGSYFRIMNMSTESVVTTNIGFTEAHGVEQISNGNILTGSLNVIRIWHLTNYSLIGTLTGHTARVNVIKEIDSFYVASGSMDNRVIIWHMPSLTLFRSLVGHSNSINHLELIANGRLLSTSLNCDIKLWNITQGVEIKSFNYGPSCEAPFFYAPSKLSFFFPLDLNINYYNFNKGKSDDPNLFNIVKEQNFTNSFYTSNLIKSLSIFDRLFCLVECKNTQNCIAILYNFSTRDCFLFSQIATSSDLVQDCIFCQIFLSRRIPFGLHL